MAINSDQTQHTHKCTTSHVNLPSATSLLCSTKWCACSSTPEGSCHCLPCSTRAQLIMRCCANCEGSTPRSRHPPTPSTTPAAQPNPETMYSYIYRWTPSHMAIVIMLLPNRVWSPASQTQHASSPTTETPLLRFTGPFPRFDRPWDAASSRYLDGTKLRVESSR